MPDGHLLLQVNWAVVETIHPESDKFVTGVKIKADDSPLFHTLKLQLETNKVVEKLEIQK